VQCITVRTQQYSNDRWRVESDIYQSADDGNHGIFDKKNRKERKKERKSKDTQEGFVFLIWRLATRCFFPGGWNDLNKSKAALLALA